MSFLNLSAARAIIQRTSATTIRMGPFLDETDGITPLTGLTFNPNLIYVSKNDTAFVANTDATPIVHDVNGWYALVIGVTETDTQGNLLVQIHAPGALPVWRLFEVVENPA